MLKFAVMTYYVIFALWLDSLLAHWCLVTLFLLFIWRRSLSPKF